MAAPALTPTRLSRLRTGLSSGERTAIGSIAAFIVVLPVVGGGGVAGIGAPAHFRGGWGVLAGIVAPAHYVVGASGTVFGVGLGVTAYTLGMRHAIDADHIAAIDNTTRKLMADGKRPVSVGFWFSLGHSSVVFGLCLLLAFGVKALAGQVENGQSTLQQTTGLIGTSVSGVFLLIIGVINLVVLRQIVGVFRRMRGGEFDEAELEEHLKQRGLIN